jgi:hypothetical protein
MHERRHGTAHVSFISSENGMGGVATRATTPAAAILHALSALLS